VVGACRPSPSPSHDDAPPTSAPPPSSAAAQTTSAALGPNELLPPEWRGKIRFETLSIRPQVSNMPTIAIEAPVQWQETFDDPKMRGWLHSPDQQNGATQHAGSMHFGSPCLGFCSPKDWAAEIAESYFKDRKIQKVLLDEPQPNQRLRVIETGLWEMSRDEQIVVVFARWKASASSAILCEATLEKDLRPLWRSFAAACSGMKESGW